MALLSGPDGVRIRAAAPGDAPALSALVGSLAGWFLADPAAPEAAAAFLRSLAPEAFAERLADPRFEHHVAEAGGEVVGMVAVRDASHLYHLFVAERFHERGIARRLWEVARTAAAAAGNRGAFTVNASLSALPVYEAFGFVPVGEAREQDGIAFRPMRLAAPGAAASAGAERAGVLPAPSRPDSRARSRTMPEIRSLKEVFGEPERPPESFARAIGPARLVVLAAGIGPRGLASGVPARPPRARSLPRPLPAGGGAGQRAPEAGRVPRGFRPG